MATENAYQPPASDFANRWEGVIRPYTKEEVERLRGSVQIAHTLGDRGSKRLWELMNSEPFVPALGALTGGQAVQSIKAGLKAIYCSGWQVSRNPINLALVLSQMDIQFVCCLIHWLDLNVLSHSSCPSSV
jgi:isocitrate lyase